MFSLHPYETKLNLRRQLYNGQLSSFRAK
jgi:hypothetical protein